MLIPAIDLMGGKVVQLVQGRDVALEFDDVEPWVERFDGYPLVQLIDLDAAMGSGDNRALVARLAGELPCQVGGGIRSVDAALTMLDAGAQAVIVGSALVHEDGVDSDFAARLAAAAGRERLVFALDSRQGHVAVGGWQRRTSIAPSDMMQALEPWCGAFLYTNIDTEGLMQGIPLAAVRRLRATTSRRLFAAGGIATRAEIETLDEMGVDAVVGMAVYTAGSEADLP